MFGAGKGGGDASGLHLAAESSKETISEAQRLYDEICQMLVAAGYFRARIPNLPPFDKMLGGLAWSITASNVDVEVDLNFDEEMTLGQKIKLAENVIAALRKMRCPSNLQPHQIRGLDFQVCQLRLMHGCLLLESHCDRESRATAPCRVNTNHRQALFPAFQWLIKHVLATREEMAAKTRRFAEMKFESAGHALEGENEQKAGREAATPLMLRIKDKYKPRRQFRRRAGGRTPLSEALQVQCVLLEYGMTMPKGRAVAEEDGGADEVGAAEDAMRDLDAFDRDLDFLSGKRIGALVGLQADAISSLSAEYAEHEKLYGDGRDPAALQRRGKEQTHRRQMASLGRQLEIATSKCDARRAAYEALAAETKATQEALEDQKGNTDKVRSEIEKLREAETPDTARDLALLQHLISVREKFAEHEEALRAHCASQRAELQARLGALEEGEGGLPAEELERIRKVEALYATETTKLKRARESLAAKTQQLHLVRRKIDDTSTRAELVQYERRFLQVYDQVAGNLEETRRYYTKYNTLSDTHKYLTKEISIHSSVVAQYPKVVGSESGKAALLEQMTSIASGVQDNLTRASKRHADESARRAEAEEALKRVAQRQRAYFKAVRDFQEECTRNEELLAKAPKAPPPPQATPPAQATLPPPLPPPLVELAVPPAAPPPPAELPSFG